MASRSQIFGRDHLAPWIHFEQYCNGIAPRLNNPLATFTTMRPEYQPMGGPFQIPLYEISRKDPFVRVYRSKYVDPALEDKFLKPEKIYFAVHPQVASEMKELRYLDRILGYPKTELTVLPTASSRSMFVIQGEPELPPYIIKAAFDGLITRWKRPIPERKIRHCIQITDDLDCLVDKIAAINPLFNYQPESIGVAYGDPLCPDRYPEFPNAQGFQVREITPRPHGDRGAIQVPLFALYSEDKKGPRGERPLLVKLIEDSWVEPFEFITQKVLFPILKGVIDVFKETGVLLEAHGQNTLLLIDQANDVLGIVYRDFDAYVNKEVRQTKGLEIDTLNPYELFTNHDTDESPQGSNFSLLFDQSMRVPLDAIAKIGEDYFEITPSELQEEYRRYFRKIFPEGDIYFPSGGEVYNYRQGEMASGAKPKVVATGKAPLWRDFCRL